MAEETKPDTPAPAQRMLAPKDFMAMLSAEAAVFIDGKAGSARSNDHGTNELIAAALVLVLAERVVYMPDATRGKVIEQLQDQLLTAVVHLRRTRGLRELVQP